MVSRRSSWAVIATLGLAACAYGPIASPPTPAVPLSNVIDEIKLELAEYNRQAAAHPIPGNACNGGQPLFMGLAGVKVELRSTLVNMAGGDIGANIPVGPIPVLVNPSGGGSRSVTNRQTTVLNFTVPTGRQTATTTPPEDMNLLKALITFRDQLGRVAGDGQCLKFADKEPASIALDFTAEEVVKGGIKLRFCSDAGCLDQPATSTDHNTITVSLDMKGSLLLIN